MSSTRLFPSSSDSGKFIRSRTIIGFKASMPVNWIVIPSPVRSVSNGKLDCSTIWSSCLMEPLRSGPLRSSKAPMRHQPSLGSVLTNHSPLRWTSANRSLRS
ncbi:Uncharacterised protein [Mycobacterium tuberculosis]|nr:Uncharacterised protein [Mycobacterium tuberculosis]